MNKLEVMFLVAVVEVGELSGFTVEELSEFWAALTVCRDDDDFFALFDAQEKEDVIGAVKKLETELRRRHKEPVNFFRLMQDNPAQVEFYLSKFSVESLFDLEADLKQFEKSEIVSDFLKLVRKQIYQRVPMA